MSLLKKRGRKAGVSTTTSSGDWENLYRERLKLLRNPPRTFDTGNVVKSLSDNLPERFIRELAHDAAHSVTRSSSRGGVSTGVKGVKGTLPSAEDLDAVAEEERIKWLTR